MADNTTAQQAVEFTFHNANEEMTPDELNRMIAETIWMADRPRTWWEWWSWQWRSLWGRN
jgi:hypothetical protein